jgi:hypothetical protein
MKLTTHLLLAPRSRMSGAIPPPQYVFMAWCSVKQRDNFTLSCGGVQYSGVQYSTAYISTTQHITIEHISAQHSTIQYSRVQHISAQYNTVHCSTVRHISTQYSTIQYSTCVVLMHVELHHLVSLLSFEAPITAPHVSFGRVKAALRNVNVCMLLNSKVSLSTELPPLSVHICHTCIRL